MTAMMMHLDPATVDAAAREVECPNPYCTDGMVRADATGTASAYNAYCRTCFGTGRVPDPSALRVVVVDEVPMVSVASSPEAPEVRVVPAERGWPHDGSDVIAVPEYHPASGNWMTPANDGTTDYVIRRANVAVDYREVPWPGGEVTLAVNWCPECLLGQGFVNDLATMRLVECPAHSPRIAGVLRVTVEALPIVDALAEPLISGEYPYLYVITNDNGAQVLLYLVTGPDEEADWQDVTDWLATGPDFTPGRYALVIVAVERLAEPVVEMVCPNPDDAEDNPDLTDEGWCGRCDGSGAVPLDLPLGVLTPVVLAEEARHG